MDFQDRLIKEFNELDSKILKLQNALNKGTIQEKTRLILNKQLKAMIVYFNILKERLKAIPKKEPLSFLDTEAISDKILRKNLDHNLQELKNLSISRERVLSITKIQEAIMWLGMDLGRINKQRVDKEPNPYPDSYDPSNAKIAPTVDGLKL